ncbi:MAG: TetR/AcrR family transcriptional regulator [Aliidongia sp.]
MPVSRPPIQIKPRKLPRQTRSAETVGVILEAAARILERDGFAGFTTNAVAERAGVSIGSLYQYFPGKEALTGALLRRESSVLLDEAAASLHGTSGQAALETLVAAAVRHQLGRPDLARLLDVEENRLPLEEQVREIGAALCATLVQILARPDLPPQADLPLAAADLLAIVKGMVDAAGARGEVEAQALQERVRRAVFGYLRS